ncbi:MAG: HD domain-containing protein, partial [Sphingobacterium sp.]|nr:HD domain-containing protein [Sphingobacterium sp.]
EAALIAILLHDIGHGPFSHSLEHSLIEGVSHEMISALLMDRLNKEFDDRLSLAIIIFNNQYPRKFLHQLVSGQLDTDRMDYLNRDSFFTGVSEGVISFDRIIKMLSVKDDELVVEAKGIYSVEKFLIARRLMYWQVYLHKTVISAEQMLIKILKRARMLCQSGEVLSASPAFAHFLYGQLDAVSFVKDPAHLDWFTKLDDTDILSAIKAWETHSDAVLRMLCQRLLRRNLFVTEMRSYSFDQKEIDDVKRKAKQYFQLEDVDVDYLVYHQEVQNSAYNAEKEPIKILNNRGELMEIAEASDLSNLEALSRRVVKYALTYPKELRAVE